MQAKTQKQFLEAYDQFSDGIFRHCWFRVFDHEKAKDLTQETFVKTWQYLSSGKKIDNIKAFLYRVANNLIIDQSRKKKEESLDTMMENEAFDIGTDERQKIFDTLDGKRVLEVAQKLDPKFRDFILMRYIDDLSPKEIAEVTGESENLISVRIHRGLEQLRKILNENG